MNKYRRAAKSILRILKRAPPVSKSLVVMLDGASAEADLYLKQIRKIGENLRVDVKAIKFCQGPIAQSEIEGYISEYAAYDWVGGIVLALPFPKTVNLKKASSLIPQEKDPDKLNEHNFQICAPSVSALYTILSALQLNLEGRKIAVVGRGSRIGVPIFDHLRQWKRCLGFKMVELISARNLADFRIGEKVLQSADLIVNGARIPGILERFKLKKGAAVVDFNQKGIGMIVLAHLFANFYTLNGCSSPF